LTRRNKTLRIWNLNLLWKEDTNVMTTPSEE
jgi:hypothetical protein